jgi:hypothetical protein
MPKCRFLITEMWFSIRGSFGGAGPKPTQERVGPRLLALIDFLQGNFQSAAEHYARRNGILEANLE